MREPVVVILDQEERQQVGAQIKEILDRTRCYNVDLVSEFAKDAKGAFRTTARLVIPVFPPAIEKAESLCRDLSIQCDTRLLPVLRPQTLQAGLDRRLPSAQDFLVTPLRDEEVCFRVTRLAQG